MQRSFLIIFQAFGTPFWDAEYHVEPHRAKLMVELYQSDLYAESNPSWHAEDSLWKANHIASMIADHNILHNRICDIGCGIGEITSILANKFPESQFHGFDISPFAIAEAQKKTTTNLAFFRRIPAAEEGVQYNLSLVIDVFEHVEDYFGFIRNVAAISEYKIFHIPLDISVQSVFLSRNVMNLRRTVGHIHYFYKDTALATIRDCGMTVLDFRYTASRIELPNQALSSRLVSWPRRAAFALNQDLAVRVLGGYSMLVLAK